MCAVAVLPPTASAAPAAPSLDAISPPSPANDNFPSITGSADPNTTIKIYSDAACTTLASSGADTDAELASSGVTVTVGIADDTTTTFHATATDAASSVSPCSAGIAYQEDSTPPAVGTGTTTNTGEIGGGGGAPGSTDCPGASVLTGVLVESAPWLRRIKAVCTTLTETNAGSTVVAASGAVVQGGFFGSDTSGSAEPQSDCPKGEVATGFEGRSDLLVDGFKLLCHPLTGPGTPTGAESQSTYVGGLRGGPDPAVRCPAGEVAVGIVGNSGDSIDSMAFRCAPIEPGTAVPLSTSPVSPADDSNPEVKGTAPPGSTVKVYKDAACTQLVSAGKETDADFEGAGITVTVANDTITTLRARAFDAAGNGSACSPDSVAYEEDSVLPDAPSSLSFSPPGPIDDNAPELLGSAPANSTVKVYQSTDCTGPLEVSGSAAAFGTTGLTVSVGNDTVAQFSATSTDLDSDVSVCSSPVSYEEDSTAPTAPSSLVIAPVGPAVPPPVVNESVSVRLVSGQITIRCPGQGPAQLDDPERLLLGCVIDTTKGRVSLTSASDSKGGTQTAEFFDGAFRVTQETDTVTASAAKRRKAKRKKKRVVTTVLTLVGKVGPCPSSSGKKASASARRAKRRLWGKGKGRFRTGGRHSSATVRGTTWFVEDSCGGTLTKVRAGTVAVRDFRLKATIIVKKGRRYFARKRDPKNTSSHPTAGLYRIGKNKYVDPSGRVWHRVRGKRGRGTRFAPGAP